MLKKLSIIVFVILFLFLLSTCVKAKIFEKESKDVLLNGSEYLRTSSDINYSVEDPSIATITDDGMLKALKIGTTTITATSSSETDTCTINVIYGQLNIRTDSRLFFSH